MSPRIVRFLTAIGLCAAACLAHGQTILCYGDSLTAGYRAPSGQSYPDFLQKDLSARGDSVQVINHGVVNMSAAQAVQSLPAALPGLLRQHPAAVLLEFGGVDALHHVPVPEITHSLETLVQPLLHAHIRVVLLAVYLPEDRVGRAYSVAFGKAYASLAAKYSLPLVPSMLKGVYTDPRRMSDDGTHPNADGYRQVALNVLPVLLPVLRR